MTIAELARQVSRDYKNVHAVIEKLLEWHAVKKDEQGRIQATYDEILVDVRLPLRRAACVLLKVRQLKVAFTAVMA